MIAQPRYTIPDLPNADELLPYLRRIDESRWYSNFGPLVSEFEDRLCKHLTASDPAPQAGDIHLTTLANCHQALAIAMRLLRLPKGATVLVPCVTFPSSALAIQEAGAIPLFGDIDPVTWSLSPEMARKIATERQIDAVMAVAVYGVPTEGWDEFSRETGIPVVIDAAAALDAQPVPAGGMVAYSMHATKPFGIGEGGVLASRDPTLIQSARESSNFGTRARITHSFGTNAKLSEYHGAVALAQLARWDIVKQRRRAVLDLYLKKLAEYGLTDGLQKNITRTVTSSLMLALDRPIADNMIAMLNAQGIGAHHCYWPPLPQHPYFAGAGCADNLPVAEALHRKLIGLPFHSFMTKEEVAHVVQSVAELSEEGLEKVRA